MCCIFKNLTFPIIILFQRSEITNHEWSFFGIYTSIEFLMSLDFMSSLNLNIQDKVSAKTFFYRFFSEFAENLA